MIIQLNYEDSMKLLVNLIIIWGIFTTMNAQSFNEFFTDKTMRIDYHHTGDKNTEIISIDRIYQYEQWSGSQKNLVDTFNNGKYFIKISDIKSGKLIYSRGFDSYYGEYELSEDAEKGIKKAFHETALIPYPKNPIKFSIEKRGDKQQLKEIFTTEIDPSDLYIIKNTAFDKDIIVQKSHITGKPSERLDIAILGDGYTAKEISKFKKDIARFTKIILNNEPYRSMKDKINIYGVLKSSLESGADEPGANIYRNTALGTTFYSMGSERYLLTEDNKTMRDIAAIVPYDAVAIMVNHSRYGGGGIYNFYCTFTADNQFHEYLLIHEFGHSFAGLADEYYTSATAYDQMFKPELEPLEANITALQNPKELKWKHLVDATTAIPTEWEKDDFDKADYAWQKERRELNEKIATLKRNKAAKEEIIKAENEYAAKDKARAEAAFNYLKNCKNFGKVGAFEGAGYLPKGMYRPMLDCIMFSKGSKPYCLVCQDAVKKRILFYAE